MDHYNMNKSSTNSYGFTLVEIMITLVISGIIMSAIYSAYLAQQRTYLAQEQVAEMQQNARVAMDMLARDIRSAGFDPNNLGAGITVAAPGNLVFTREDDLAANGLESVAYSLFDAFMFTVPPSNDGLVDDLAQQVTTVAGASAGRQVVAENIGQLEFRYLDEDGNVTATLADIRSVQVSILAVASRADQNFTNTMSYTTGSGAAWGPYNDNFRRRMLITTIQCRNMGL
jgi:type IV pilus assembly protein PilW